LGGAWLAVQDAGWGKPAARPAPDLDWSMNWDVRLDPDYWVPADGNLAARS
jgi:hypothetical protein